MPPPLEDGKVRIFSMRFCPHANKPRLVLAHKGIPLVYGLIHCQIIMV